MKTSVDRIGTNKVRLAVEVPPEDVRRELDRTYRRLASELRVPGFRPGRVPRPVIDQRVGRDFVRREALREALPRWLAEAVKASELEMVAPPEVDVRPYEDGEALTFEAVVEVKPTPEVRDYLGIRVSRPPVAVTDEEVERQLEVLRNRYASLEPVARPAREGDFVLIDLTTYRHDQTIDELTARDLLVEVGGGMVVAELDAELVGKRAGDILKLTATLPQRFGERAGWQVGMQVLVKEVKARRLPPLDDELARMVSELDTLDELRGDIRRRLEELKAAQAQAVVRERVLEAFVERCVTVELPEGMVRGEVERLLRQMARALAARGLSLEGYLEQEKIDLEALAARLRPQAERNLTAQLGLEAVAAAEGLQVTDQERQRELERLARAADRPPDEVRRVLERSGDLASVDGDILRAKALDLLVERAVVEEEGPP